MHFLIYKKNLIAERTKAGLDAARRLGRTGGRKRKMTKGKIDTAKDLFEKQVPPKDIAETLNISVPTLYRWLPAANR
jgi:DNA invertase Pin-like site-specific DNA recombinase